MGATKCRYSKEEYARRGDALVESRVRPNLTAAGEDKFVAIDIETGKHQLDKNELRATDRLRKRVPDAQIWLVHVALGHLHRFGGHGLPQASTLSSSGRLYRRTEDGGEHEVPYRIK